MVGKWNSFWEGLFSGAMLVSGSVIVRIFLSKKEPWRMVEKLSLFFAFWWFEWARFFLVESFFAHFPANLGFFHFPANLTTPRKFLWKKTEQLKKKTKQLVREFFSLFFMPKRKLVCVYSVIFWRILPWDSSPWDLVWICWVGDFSEGFYHGKSSPFFTTTWGICGVIFSQPPWPKQS